MTRVETIGDCVLYNADCREILPTLGKVDAVVTDPPYGVELGVAKDMRGGRHGSAKQAYDGYEDTIENFRETIVPAIERALKIAERGAVFLNNNLHELPKPDAIGAVFAEAAQGRHCWGFNSVTLVGLYGKAPELNKGGFPVGYASTETSERNGHPCPKPLGWMKWVVTLASRRRQTILDPFMGSGTTGVACVKLGRKFVGIEIEEKYFNIAVKRITDAHRQKDLFINAQADYTPPTQLPLLRGGV